jgi:hypothetical protein
MGTRSKLALRLGFVALSAGLVLSLACSGDDDNGATSAPQPNGSEMVEVTAVDYGFKDLPKTLAVGSTLELKNDSTKELHELVAIRLPDSEKRPVGDLIKLSDEELGEIASTEPAMVLIAPPTEEGFAVVGNGTFTVAGRYAILCFIPTGADPAAIMAAAAEGGTEQPEIAGGPPHAFQGMYGEITVN